MNFKLLEEGPIRSFLRKRPIMSSLLPQLAIWPPVDRELEIMRERKKLEWKAKGYPEGLIDKALILADRWVSSMAAAFTPPGREDIREAIIKASYPKALEVAERWIIEMSK